MNDTQKFLGTYLKSKTLEGLTPDEQEAVARGIRRQQAMLLGMKLTGLPVNAWLLFAGGISTVLAPVGLAGGIIALGVGIFTGLLTAALLFTKTDSDDVAKILAKTKEGKTYEGSTLSALVKGAIGGAFVNGVGMPVAWLGKKIFGGAGSVVGNIGKELGGSFSKSKEAKAAKKAEKSMKLALPEAKSAPVASTTIVVAPPRRGAQANSANANTAPGAAPGADRKPAP